MNVVVLLDKLEGVKETGPGRWIARCPSHDDKSPSLSIRDVGDKLLLCCFAGCDAIDIVHSIGLELADLFDRPLEHSIKPTHSRIPARDLLELIDRQAMIVAVIAGDILQSRSVDEASFQLLADAVRRIGEARDIAAPARIGR